MKLRSRRDHTDEDVHQCPRACSEAWQLVLDIRRPEDAKADARTVPTAQRHDPSKVDEWAKEQPRGPGGRRVLPVRPQFEFGCPSGTSRARCVRDGVGRRFVWLDRFPAGSANIDRLS